MAYRFFSFALLTAALLVFGCSGQMEQEEPEQTVISVSLPDNPVARTVMGPSVGGTRKVYWCDGDCMSLNGTASNPLSGVGEAASSASFVFPGVLDKPYRLLYPASFWKDASTVTLPAEQVYAAGSFATNTEPLAGYVPENSTETTVSLAHLCAVIKLSVSKDAGVSASSLSTVKFYGNADEQVCGDFSIDYTVPSLSTAAESGEGRELVLNVAQPLVSGTPLELYLVVPAGEYASGFRVVLEDNQHRTMTKVKSTASTLDAGSLKKMTAFTFVPSSIATSFEIEAIEEEVLEPDGFNITGRVVDNAGSGLEGVVVSDGTQCVRTMFDGSFYLTSDLASVKFVYVSTPSGYMPVVEGGIPKFYKLLSEGTLSAGVRDMGDYVMTPVANPDRFTLLITADPQPRNYSSWNNDRIAFKSVDVCQDLYQELYDVYSGISGRQVYGICLGDIVHESMNLYGQYNEALEVLGYPTYNVIGNHDNDPSASDDDSGALYFESYYGPRNYSFNIGGIHFVVLDDLIMKLNPQDNNRLTAFDHGLTDEIWAWLQADLSFIPTSSKLMVCGHSPMFRTISGGERSRDDKSRHGSDYGDLINNYAEVHAWAGHTHVGFNYNYPSDHRHKRIQVHTLARSTGELWTNEYLAAGTPRGFTIVEVDNGEISWRFHPLTRQRGAFMGVTSGICKAGPPAYTWRDWDYTNGVAVMRNGGGPLDENYQIHAYPRGAYEDNYVYANIFLWDDKWELPVWTPDGGTPVTMELLTSELRHDIGNTEIKTHYKANVGFLTGDAGYPASEVGEIATLFRAPATATPNRGTVSVTDRFGNTYSRTVQW